MARRDDAEFTEFVRARSGMLLRTAYLILGDHALAQDLVQEALTKVYVAWPRIQRREGVDAYARTVVVNTAISWKRRRGWRGEQPVGEVPEPRGAAADEPDVRLAIWRTLQDLPPRQRATLVLRFYEDLSIKETAQVMQCAEGTVKSQVSQGIERLRETLGSRAAALGHLEAADREHEPEGGVLR
ncbi:SigE family RNA polymerase sigma factor [Nocardioides marmoribigeumensis]|uniref:RNA polymerase sigma-70 factor (Sigma-E family) n=1 Tax=Nocardioides marmoribigeumensis TaxID=433649 RepID=A0ABU2BWR9_9ACTN|nr:SigE family RNA polymerase sigma factor [Nocardioides marmoribigeumensis]MDR7362774.1 RNA polymerase sigma-70 factor (sigma-E family) [Nocardioides marmoribigeumensis]